jgi:hypothetical protein
LTIRVSSAVITSGKSSGFCGSAAIGLVAVLLTLAASDTWAQGRLEANYEVSVAGITIGKGAWLVEVADDQYSAAMTGGSSGILRAISSGQGTGVAQGRVVKGQLQPAAYTATVATERKSETIRISLVNGTVKDWSIDPAPPEDLGRIPVTDADKRGVSDPMTASLVRVGGAGDPVSADACSNGAAVFDGRMRYDLSMEFKRIENVKVDGYQGPVVVCAIYFTPLAGYDPSRAAIKYLAGQRHMEAWLAPIEGTRILVPFRFTIPTPLGTGKLEATKFVSTPAIAHGGAAVPKTQ